ncbi:MAG: formate dehydrogenase [Burkholderiaceae bacterium]
MNTKVGGDSNTKASPLKRRGLLLGVGAAGAVALAAKTLPGAAPVVGAAATVAPAVDTSAGYRATPHVLQYYETARS